MPAVLINLEALYIMIDKTVTSLDSTHWIYGVSSLTCHLV